MVSVISISMTETTAPLKSESGVSTSEFVPPVASMRVSVTASAEMAAPEVSLVHGIYEPVRLTEKSQERCRELGRVVAEKAAGKN